MRNGYGHMVMDDYVRRLRELDARRAERLAAITTRDEAQAYCAEAGRRARACLGPLPERTPLRPRITGEVRRDGYRIEKLLLESRPGVLVTANLYLPNDLAQPAPAVLGTCGHSEEGKAAPLYQAFCQRLARAGFVTLSYDPINQGERDQYHGLAERSLVQYCVPAHNMMGKQLQLVGDWFGAWRLWDGIRCLDYMLSRPEVDPTRVGVTGNSGGGTMTTWLFAADSRFTMAAPSCFITTFLHNLENEEAADAEQYPPGAIANGLEMVDFVLGRAPAPLILLGQHNDFFDRRGLEQAIAETERIYDLLGAADHFDSFVGEHTHGYYAENQAAMVRFFCRQAGLDQPETTEADDPLSPEELWATPGGQVVSAGAEPIPQIIARTARKALAQAPSIEHGDYAAALTDLLKLPPRPGIPYYRVLRPTALSGHTLGRYAIETERDLRAILLRVMPEDNPNEMALDAPALVQLWLPHQSAEDDLTNEPLAHSLAAQGQLFGLDARGLGESRPDDHRSFWNNYGLDYMAHGYGLLFGESYLGRRVYDVLRTIDLLCAQGAKSIQLYGRGQGALLAVFSALLDERIAHITLLNAPTSLLAWAQQPVVAWPATNFLPGFLQHFDLPACLKVLGDRVTVHDQIEPVLQ